MVRELRERRNVSIHICEIDIGAVRDEQPDDIGVSIDRCIPTRSAPVVHLRIDYGAK